MDKRIKAVLEPFMTLTVRVANLENKFDTGARKMIGVDLDTFRAALDKVKAEVRILQQH